MEHHANIVHETEKEAWKLLTERWDSEIILTSLVQFLNALFRIENSCVRRMHRLSHSVIVFDEVQSLPKQCQKLFESAVSFLTRRCGCTVVLCTATQPSLSFKPKPQELVPDRQFLYDNEEKDALRRLPDVKRGQNVAGTVIRHFTETRMDLGSPQVMDEYFKIESREIQAEDPA